MVGTAAASPTTTPLPTVGTRRCRRGWTRHRPACRERRSRTGYGSRPGCPSAGRRELSGQQSCPGSRAAAVEPRRSSGRSVRAVGGRPEGGSSAKARTGGAGVVPMSSGPNANPAAARMGSVSSGQDTESAGTAVRRGPSQRTRQVIKGVLSLVLVVGIFYFLFKRIDFAEVWAEIRAMTWLELTVLLLIALWNLLTYVLVWMTVTTPRLSFGRGMLMTQSTTAVSNTVPGGAAIGIGMTYSMMGQWGYSRSRTTTAVLVSGVWNSFIKLGLPVFALAVVALQGRASSARVIAALVGLAGLVAAVVVFGA